MEMSREYGDKSQVRLTRVRVLSYIIGVIRTFGKCLGRKRDTCSGAQDIRVLMHMSLVDLLLSLVFS